MMNILNFLTLSSLFLVFVNAQDTPNCPQPATFNCLSTQAQFTVLGTVIGNNLNAPGTIATTRNYNASVRIDCVYSSFSNPPSTLVQGGLTYTVTRWGAPQSSCPNGGGATANANDTKIFFFYLATRGVVSGQIPVLSVFDVCTGGFPATQQNLQQISNVLATSPAGNKILSGTNCTLPQADPSASPRTSLTLDDNAGFSVVGPVAAHSALSWFAFIFTTLCVVFAL